MMNFARSIRPFMRGLLLAGCVSTALLANTGGIPAGYSGAPEENSCSVCHDKAQTPNSGMGGVSIQLVNATGYTAGRSLRLRITVSDPFANRWGFQLTVRRGLGYSGSVGGFAAIAGQGTEVAPSESNATHIAQSPSGVRLGMPGRVAWEVDWNAPASLTGSVIFYVAGVASNGNSAADAGDFVYTSLLVVQPGGEGIKASKVLPQFVFGQGFTSTVSFANLQQLPATVRVNFFTAEGNEMPVNGNSSRLLNLPAYGSATIRADDTGPLTQGWALIDMPDGVTGSGTFRQRVPGRIDQEAVVLLSRTDSKSERFIYDQTPGFDTALVLLNTSTLETQATLRIRDENGTQVGQVSKILQPRTRVTIDFRREQGLSGGQGKRGLAEFDGGAGTIAVLALRFDDAGSITSIPNAEK